MSTGSRTKPASAASVYLKTLGCRLNEAELASWESAFEARGHRMVSRAQDANLIVLNTCAVTNEASRKSRKAAAGLHRESPSAKLVITGCMSELEPEKAAALTGVDLVIDNQGKDTLVETVLATLDLEDMPAMATEGESRYLYPGEAAPGEGTSLVSLGRKDSRTRAFIKVQDGCRNKCSYCVVTIARGDERSRRIDELVAEIQELSRRGYQEAVLTGVHLGGYGHDLGTNLSALVRRVLNETSIPRVRLSSLEPWDLPDDFGSLWEHPRLMPHLHLPLQSGSDSVLRRMSRRCFTEEFGALCESLRAQVPDLQITTDLIVGFPGESDEEFADTLQYIESIGFGHMHIFGFSAREGTRAATLPGRVPGPTIKERSREVHRVAARMKEAFYRRYLGSEREILWESERDSDEGKHWLGYTDNYLRVETQSEASLRNRIARGQLVAVEGCPVDRLRVR